MHDNPKFAKLVADGKPTGEVIGVDRFLVIIRGLGDIGINALVYFENGHQGIVREVHDDTVMILNMTAENVPVATLVVLEADELMTMVGDNLIGRVISPVGLPLDGKGPLSAGESRPVFTVAPGIIERKELADPMITGVAIVDQLFPLVRGQRIAVLGDNKVGKTAFTTTLALSQKGTNQIVVFVMIAKRKSDVDKLIGQLNASGAMAYCVVVVATIFDTVTQSYLAPYIGAAIAEYFWHNGRDCIIIYDDLSNHAKLYRELSLLLKVSPGRDSYPGDMFYAHSSLLERAGRLVSNGATLGCVPVILTPNNDITAYLPTTIMSITDGQLIFDSETFRSGIRPAISVGLSVTRVGGVGQKKRQQALRAALLKKLASFRQAEEFSHFGSELAIESRQDLELGKKIYEAFKQAPDAVYTINEQDLILETVMKSEGKIMINVDQIKRKAKEIAPTIDPDGDWTPFVADMLAQTTVQAPAAAAPAKDVAAAAPALAAAPVEAKK